ncbi:MAG: SdrD B-like domain-containing protein, partial [bacterium]|nr:SdrD B-like domain-containing protein [bacterium]
IKPGARQIYGMTLRHEVLSRLTLKPYFIYSQSNLDEDSLSRKTNSGGLGLEIKPWNWLGWDISFGMTDRDRQIQGAAANRKSLLLNTSANLRFKPLTFNLGYDYSDPYYQASSPAGRQGPRAGIWWRPAGFVSFNGNINQSRPVGSAISYRTEALQRGLGASLNLPRMPLINLDYQQGDQDNSYQNQISSHYRTVTQGVQLSQRYPKYDWSLRYRLSDNRELSQNLQQLITQNIDGRVTRFWGGQSSWLNFEQTAYFDHLNGTSSRTGWGKLGTEGRFYSWITLGAEAGTGLENQGGGKRLLWQHSLQTRMNLPWNFTAQGYWRNNRNLKKIADGRDYDQNSFSFSISKRIGLEGTSIEGQVFNDVNRNGQRDQDEPGLSRVKLTLNDGQETMTDKQGSYGFGRIRTRQAKVAVDLVTLSADYNLVGRNEVVVATGGWRGNVVNFAVTSLGGIKGRVFVDINSNGVFDDGDYGIPGVTLLLQPANLSAVSNGGGNFRFYNVPVGKNEVMVDSTSVPGELELNIRQSKLVSIKQGELTNGLEFSLVKKVRKVKKIVFGGESLVTVASAAPVPAPAKISAQTKPAPERSRVVTP